MEIKEMTMSDIETRSLEITEELSREDADVEALEAEVTELEERKAEILKEAEERRAKLEEVKRTSQPVKDFKKENEMENIEIRNTKEYIDAYAEYLRTGDDRTCRTLMTENGGGNIPVPDFVFEEVKRAWNEDGILGRVRKQYLKGNIQIPFELSASGAVVQTEGQQINEQDLIMGFVEMKPEMIKKYVKVTTQVEKLDDGEKFIRYIYEELAHYIAAKATEELLDKIDACGTASTTTMVAVASIDANSLSVGLVAQALGELSSEANDPVVMLNRKTWAALKAVQYANGYNVDPFEGLPVEFNNHITAWDAATTGDTIAIIGDLGYGALANFPDGEGIDILRDPYTLADYNIVRYRGDEFVALGVVAPYAFCKIAKN